jgi:hypothetical protein
MNPRHLALVLVASMGCSTNGAIDAASTPVDAFDAATLDANTDASTADANTDASTTDAGTSDVGSFSEFDANADAHIGPMDAGMSSVDLDASTTDATDANTTDASTTDASTTDASTTDASTTDASTTDASTTDDANTNDANVDCGMRGPARAAGCDTV